LINDFGWEKGLENPPPPSPLKSGASSPLKMGTKVAEDSAGSKEPAAEPRNIGSSVTCWGFYPIPKGGKKSAVT